MRRLGGRRNARGGAGGGLEVPQTVSGLYAWWRADSGITLSTGVSSWADKTGQHTAVQATGANQPAYTTAAELGGKPVLSFDGSNDRLGYTGAAANWKYIHDGTGHTTFCVFVCRRNTGTQNGLFGTSNGATTTTPGFEFSVYGPAVNALTSYTNSSSARVIGGGAQDAFTTAVLNTKCIADFSYIESGSPEFTIRRNDATIVSGSSLTAPTSNNPGNNLSIGCSGNLTVYALADIAEIISYTRVLSAGEKTAVYNYLNARYT